MMKSITHPTLLLDETICRSNIKGMADKAEKHNLAFKPHMKTHQSAEIGQWLAEVGVTAITVSSLKMARYFADHGWDDITIAFPCNTRAIPQIDELASKINLTLLVNDTTTAQKLGKKLSHAVQVYIELDTGSDRTGLQVNQIAMIQQLISVLNNTKHLRWQGFYSHPGHSYDARSKEEIREIHQSVVEQCKQLRSALSEAEPFEICIGDTPCCSVAATYDNIDAISPGNFVFYDLMQAQIGSCQTSDIAVAMACPVVDKYPQREQLVIHGGAVHFSKESMSRGPSMHYGLVAERDNDHWNVPSEPSYLAQLSQEHGIIQCSTQDLEKYQIGDILPILPVHSCLTANLMKSYQLISGGKITQLPT